MPVYTYFDSPTKYQNPENYYDVGASPYLLERLLHHLEEQKDKLATIYIAFYLFNNKVLSDKLAELAKLGIAIHIITIPIKGYDSENPKEITAYSSNEYLGEATKYTLARGVFEPYYRGKFPGATLSFFPHQYIRSAAFARFSRGDLPYSMHIKTMLAINKNGDGFTAFSSSNFAVRDVIKEEYLVVSQNEPQVIEPCKQFFSHLLAASVPIRAFDFGGNYNHFRTGIKTSPTTNNVGFTAPFYLRSNPKTGKAIVQLINGANSSIKIAAQHVCPGNDDEYGNILQALLNKAAAGVKIEIISQTFATGDVEIDKHFRSPANTKAFIDFYHKILRVANISYYTNHHLHSKYIVADSRVFISSFNYTPTQFIYRPNVEIETDKIKYSGVFSECGIYAVIDDKSCVTAFNINFEELKSSEHSYKIQ